MYVKVSSNYTRQAHHTGYIWVGCLVREWERVQDRPGPGEVARLQGSGQGTEKGLMEG